MKTIRKQTADLKFGDVVFSSSRPDVVFVRFLAQPPLPPGMAPSGEYFVELLEQDGSTKSVCFPASVEVVSNLTPAQQHADELLAYVREVKSASVGERSRSARELLDKIDPPQPPTLDEALSKLAALEAWLKSASGDVVVRKMPSTYANDALRLLDRARRSGVLS